ncbi:hypothetical protein FMM75_23260 [Lachnospiraceae bacterium MD335]|nr:hypothetical protein [Lachnospiraceae bacterium MD335]
MSIETTLFDWKLKHPILISSGPLSTNSSTIISALNHGAAAIVTKTISDEYCDSKGKIIHYSQDSLFNCDGFSKLKISQWVDNWKEIKGYPVIANIHASSPEKLAELAFIMVNAGAEVLELGLSCPTFDNDPICFDLKKLHKYCTSVRGAVNVPIIVKTIVNLSKEMNRETIRCLDDAGMDGVTLSDSLPAFIKRNGGITGSFLKPLVMRALLDIEDSKLCKIAVGGVYSEQDVKDYIECGASAVGVCSMVLKKGWSEFEKLVSCVSNENC